MKEAVAYCRVACAKQSDPSAEAQLQEHMVRRYADAFSSIPIFLFLLGVHNQFKIK
ncbi:MAG: hypothetical protein WBS14_22105 [Rhodomicrobium sp.]